MTPTSTPSRPASPVVARRRLTIHLEGGEPSALLRALTTLHRRRFQVLWLQYTAEDGAAHELHAVVEGPVSHVHCLDAWLGALVEVRAVDSRSAWPCRMTT